ncbi:MAG: radical SAM family heme chaperone HemW [Erysipelotrichales bacterium]|nr:radical SAM family heme chaperone HemW [Erysipelotrichales bacterium]
MEAVYIHIPFCKHICSYCDFPKVLHIDSFVEDYLESLQREIENNYDGERIKSIYIGGGTPSCLTKKERIKLFRILEIFNRTPDCEYTFEINPSDIDEDLLDDIVDGGINRVSIGIESFDFENLKILERETDYKDIENKLNLIKKRGIININLDLMYAIPGEKLSVLKQDLKKLIKLDPTHISTYSLIIENNTKLNNDNAQYIDEELDLKMYNEIRKILKKAGYKHYEVSNFAKEGYESRHNLNYWNNAEYYGFGLGAAGYKAGFRYTNTKNLHEYIDGNHQAESLLMTYKEQMDNELMLGLRKIEGVDVNEFYDKYGENIQDVYPIKELLESKELIYKSGHIFIPEDKIYIMNEILIKLI